MAKTSFDREIFISVADAFYSLQNKAKFNRNDLALCLLFCILPIGVAILFFFNPDIFFIGVEYDTHAIAGNHRYLGSFLGVVLLNILAPFTLTVHFRGRIRSAKKKLSVYKDTSELYVKMNENGITLPILIILDENGEQDWKQPALFIKWSDISKWRSGYIRDNRTNGEKGMSYFAITRQQDENDILIDRSYLKKDEKKLIEFARQYISITGNVLSKTIDELCDIWGNRLFWAIKLVLLTFLLGIFFLYLAKVFFGFSISFL